MDSLFTVTLRAVLEFSQRVPGGSVPVAWYAARVSNEYAAGCPTMLLLAIMDEAGDLFGHCLALVEESYGRRMCWVYQTFLSTEIPGGERLRIIRQGLRILDEWAKSRQCVAMGMATRRNVRAMQRRFGFSPTVTLLERPIGGA
jgi:hypothetical protein